MKLYTYFRSSAAYRVRIALNLKNLQYETHCVNLIRDGGEQYSPEYQSLNPQGLVPTLVDGQLVLTQSLAIIEYLEENYPEPPLLPADTAQRAYVRCLANIVACDIHPLNNLRVLNYLKNCLEKSDECYLIWYRYWIYEGFRAIEEHLKKHGSSGKFCMGSTPTMADACLVPQVYNAMRFECDLSFYPLVKSIYQHCLTLEAFRLAAPERQPDAKHAQSSAPPNRESPAPA
ncbi:MAG: maleylacetoacetate isomerase [Pseudomonadota bacterium]